MFTGTLQGIFSLIARQLSLHAILHPDDVMPASSTKKLGASSTAGTKRKLGADKSIQATKYYAVRAGRTPGVYSTWTECQHQTAGFRGASCKPG